MTQVPFVGSGNLAFHGKLAHQGKGGRAAQRDWEETRGILLSQGMIRGECRWSQTAAWTSLVAPRSMTQIPFLHSEKLAFLGRGLSRLEGVGLLKTGQGKGEGVGFCKQ